jgi:hypothetical protein
MRSMIFRFIRDNNTDGATDDIATISYAGNNIYKLKFKTPHSEGDANKPVVMMLDDKQVFRWVRRMMSLLECDTDPFTGVQLDIPIMPSIMLDVKNLSRDYTALLDAVEFQLDNWSNTVVRQVVPKAPARNSYNASRAVENDDNDSMPPLVQEGTSNWSFMTPPRVNRHHLFFDEE